jgi:hypothetical protein
MGLRSLALVSLFGLAACGSGGNASMQLYPLQGPIAADDPTLVIEAKAKNTEGTSGPLTFRLPGKVKCEGTWSSVSLRGGPSFGFEAGGVDPALCPTIDTDPK